MTGLSISRFVITSEVAGGIVRCAVEAYGDYDLEARTFKGFSAIIEQYKLSVHGGEETKGKR
jgi:hypothetical protein